MDRGTAAIADTGHEPVSEHRRGEKPEVRTTPYSVPLCLAMLMAATPAAADTERYDISIMGRPAGNMELTATCCRRLDVHFEYNDRGRGPSVDTHLELDASGVPVLLENAGNDYLKTPIEERFELQDGVARWSGTVEHGKQQLEDTAFFISLNGPPVEIGLLAAGTDAGSAILINGAVVVAFAIFAAGTNSSVRHLGRRETVERLTGG